MIAVQAFVLILALAALLATGLPFIKTERWWVRACDYPKPQVLILCAVALVLWLIVARDGGWLFVVIALLLALASIHNAMLILPFTRVWKTNVADASGPTEGSCVSILISNVLMENTGTEDVSTMIAKHQPDIVFLAETNQRWIDAMAPVAADYGHVTSQPQENYYGLMFMTRLDVETVETRFLIKDDMPSIKATLRTREGRVFHFYGMHPEPPQVGQDSDQRDGELMVLAKEIKADDTPAIVGGDLNDVAWSHTTREFKRISDLLDPRIGRGLFASFHADYWLASWPLDHLFNSTHFTLSKLGLHPSIGSDHFPVYATLCMTPDAQAVNDGPDKGGDLDEADEKIAKAREQNS